MESCAKGSYSLISSKEITSKLHSGRDEDDEVAVYCWVLRVGGSFKDESGVLVTSFKGTSVVFVFGDVKPMVLGWFLKCFGFG
jgi:hypothetical protein